MAELRATPMVNPVMGLLADRLKKVQQFGAKPFGYENPPVEMLMNLLGVPAVQQTMERMAYGEPLTTGRGMTTKPRAEAVEAAMTLLPASAGLAKATKGLPVGASIKNVGDDLLSYRGSHKAPSPDFGAPLHDLTGGGQMYPADVYSAKATQFYGTGYPKADKEAFDLAKRVRGNPDAEVTMYRAVPKDENIKTINAGDWVTLSKDYAKTHGESVLQGDYKIISQKVKAKELWTNADSIHEFGYQPQKKAIAPQQEALDTAQRNAALTIEEGGLGLPKDNTPEMRAKAMGFDTPVYHGTSSDISEVVVLPEGRRYVRPFYTTADTSEDAAEFASQFANTKSEMGSPRVMPLLMRGDVIDIRNNPEAAKKLTDIAEQSYTELRIGEKGLPTWGQVNNYATEAKNAGIDAILLDERPYLNSIANLNPKNIRSRFAAFDPMRRDEADILAGVLPLGLLADEEQRKKIYELMPSLLGQ